MSHHDRSLDMLSKALEMEQKGYEFYERTISACRNELGVKIFTMLRDDEVIHTRRIKAIYESLKGGQPWGREWKNLQFNHRDLTVMFKDLAKAQGPNISPGSGDLEALEVGIDFETRAVAFYEGHLAAATDPLEREFIEHMIEEEKGHHTALADMKYFLADPAAWFREQEGSAFDGGTALG